MLKNTNDTAVFFSFAGRILTMFTILLYGVSLLAFAIWDLKLQFRFGARCDVKVSPNASNSLKYI